MFIDRFIYEQVHPLIYVVKDGETLQFPHAFFTGVEEILLQSSHFPQVLSHAIALCIHKLPSFFHYLTYLIAITAEPGEEYRVQPFGPEAAPSGRQLLNDPFQEFTMTEGHLREIRSEMLYPFFDKGTKSSSNFWSSAPKMAFDHVNEFTALK